MKRFVFVQYGFETPTQEIVAAWNAWFASLGDRHVESLGFATGVRVSHTGTTELAPRAGDATGVSVIEAEDLAAAEEIAKACPFVDGVDVYEVRAS